MEEIKEEQKKAIIVGAGVAGIATAIRLQKKGYQVQVFEKNSYLGGKLTSIKKGDFTFDAGPSLLTMPYLIDDLLRLADIPLQSVFKYHPLSIACKYYFADGKTLIAYADAQKRNEEFQKKLNIKPSKLGKYLQKTRYMWNITAPIFLYKSLHQIKSYLSLSTLWRALNLPFIGINSSMAKMNHKWLNNPHAEQYFNRFATYNGSNPYQAPATLNVISYLEHFEGAFYPEDSMISINQSLVGAAEKLGVVFRLNQNVQEIQIVNKKAQGIIANEKFHPADVVISNADVYSTYKYLIPNKPIPKNIAQQERSSSAMIFYWGINKTFDELDVHNILFSKDYKMEFEEIWKHKTISQDPTVYINISSKYNPNDAPKGKENWFVMINVPGNLEIDWKKEKENIKSRIIQKINTLLKTNIEKYIVEEDTLSPFDIQNKTASHLGALYGSASNQKLAAFFRQANKMSIASNLYAVGGSVHPGGGIPLCLLSAKITAEMIPNP